MKRNLLISFVSVLVMIFVMRWQGSSLVTPLTQKGIIDLEFAKTPERFDQIRLFLDHQTVVTNIYIDFLFIAAYAAFLVIACRFVRSRTGWEKWSSIFSSFAFSAAFFDVCENFLMLMVWNGRFDPAAMQFVFYCAIIKFALAALVILFLLVCWPFVLKGKRSS